jgi:uncharacterized membrane protein
MRFLEPHAVALVTFMVIDLIWLGSVATSFYQTSMGRLMRTNVKWADLSITPGIEDKSPRLTRTPGLGRICE